MDCVMGPFSPPWNIRAMPTPCIQCSMSRHCCLPLTLREKHFSTHRVYRLCAPSTERCGWIGDFLWGKRRGCRLVPPKNSWRLTLLHIIYPARWMEDDHFPFFSWVMAVGEPAVKIFQGVYIFGNNPTQMVPFCGSTYWFPPGFFLGFDAGPNPTNQIMWVGEMWLKTFNELNLVEFGWSQQN